MTNIDIQNILFLDIETVPETPAFEDLDAGKQSMWDKKSAFFRKGEESAADVFGRAGIYAEFGRIVCISVGLVKKRDGVQQLRLKSFFSDDEKKILQEFIDLLARLGTNKNLNFCGHNVKEFDLPFIARRILINALKLPDLLKVAGKKPWEVPFLDTMEMWRFGDYKNYTSLELLTSLFDIPTPKDDIDGSQVAEVYWKDKDMERIARYCEKDVQAVVQLYLRLKSEALIKPEYIESATFS